MAASIARVLAVHESRNLCAIRGIICVAGEPGDRWLGCRKTSEREESPDTVLRHAYPTGRAELWTGQRAW